jgi:hypothetical protein
MPSTHASSYFDPPGKENGFHAVRRSQKKGAQRAKLKTWPTPLRGGKLRSVDKADEGSANGWPARKVSKRGRIGEGRPSLYTPELAERLAEHIATGLTDEEAAALEGIALGCLANWRRENPEFLSAIKSAEAKRLKLRLARIEAGEAGWQGTAWALERIYPQRFARPEVLNNIAVVNGNRPERIMVIDSTSFDSLIGRPGYRLRNNEELEFKEGGASYLIVRQTSNAKLLDG